MPPTVGVTAGSALTLAAPMLGAVGAVAAPVAKVQLQVVREGTPGEDATTDGTRGSHGSGAGQPDITPLGDGS